MKGKKFGFGILSVVILLALVAGMGCKKKAEPPASETPPPETVVEKPAPQPTGGTTQQASVKPEPIGDPSWFIFYKADMPSAGKEYQALDLKVGEEITISVQALDKNGRDTGLCPTSWESPGSALSLSSIAGNCKATKAKAQKANASAVLNAIYSGAKGNRIEAPLKGVIK